MVRRCIANLGQIDVARLRIQGHRVRHMQVKGAIRGRDMSQLRLDLGARGEDRKLAGKNIEQDQRQRYKKHHRRESHQQIGDNQPVAYLPQKASEDPAPEQRNAHQNQKKERDAAQGREGRARRARQQASQGKYQINNQQPEGETMDLAPGRVTAQAPEYSDLKITKMSHLSDEFS